MSELILLRHGQSDWNKKNLFTGWIDIPLSKEGIEESLKAGEEIKTIPIDVIFTSTLIRGMMTALLAMSRHESEKVPLVLHPGEGILEEWGQCYNPKCAQSFIPVIRAWQLNERMYGKLQGMNKQEMREKYGEEQVQLWRRSYDIPPPDGESLKMTAERTIPYFQEKVISYLQEGKNVLISAHGNSLRSIVMDLDNLSQEEVLKLEIPTGQPIFYLYKNGIFKKRP